MRFQQYLYMPISNDLKPMVQWLKTGCYQDILAAPLPEATSPIYFDVLYLRALAYFAQAKYEEALYNIALITSVRKNAPREASAFILQGLSYQNLKLDDLFFNFNKDQCYARASTLLQDDRFIPVIESEIQAIKTPRQPNGYFFGEIRRFERMGTDPSIERVHNGDQPRSAESLRRNTNGEGHHESMLGKRTVVDGIQSLKVKKSNSDSRLSNKRVFNLNDNVPVFRLPNPIDHQTRVDPNNTKNMKQFLNSTVHGLSYDASCPSFTSTTGLDELIAEMRDAEMVRKFEDYVADEQKNRYVTTYELKDVGPVKNFFHGRARDLLEREDFELAIKMFNEALKEPITQEQKLVILLERADAHFLSGDYVTAFDLFREGIVLAKSLLQALLQGGGTGKELLIKAVHNNLLCGLIQALRCLDLHENNSNPQAPFYTKNAIKHIAMAKVLADFEIPSLTSFLDRLRSQVQTDSHTNSFGFSM